MKIDMLLLGERIKEARCLRGKTLLQVAEAIGVNKSTVLRYERGVITRPKVPVISSMAQELAVNPLWLLGLSDNMEAAGNSTPGSAGDPECNVVRIAGRNGSFVEKRLTDEQVRALCAILDQLPGAPEDL